MVEIEITRAYNLISGIIECTTISDLLAHAEESPEHAHACANLLAVIETHHARGEA